MTVPDELMQAAAEALSIECRLKPGGECVKYARVAIRAAFAKLPECEAARAVVEAGIVQGTGHAEWDGTSCPVLNDSDEMAVDVLAALARKFGGRE